MVLQGGWRAEVKITQTEACREIQGDPGRRPKEKKTEKKQKCQKMCCDV